MTVDVASSVAAGEVVEITLADDGAAFTGAWEVKLVDGAGDGIGATNTDVETVIASGDAADTDLGASATLEYLVPLDAAAGTDYWVVLSYDTGNTAVDVETSAAFEITSSDIVVEGTQQLGDTETVHFEKDVSGLTGAYAIKVFSSDDTEIGTLATGADASAIADTAWTIPVKSKTLVADGTYYLSVVSTETTEAFTAFNSNEFTLAVPTTTHVMAPDTWGAGATETVTWSNIGPNGSRVDILLVQGTKAKKIAKGLPNTGSAEVEMPIKAAAGVDYAIRVVGSTKGTGYADSAAVEITEPSGFSVSVDDDTLYRGQTTIVSVETDDTMPVDVNLVDTSTGKAVAKIAKKATTGDYELTVPVKKIELDAAGRYEIQVVPSKMKKMDAVAVPVTIEAVPTFTVSADSDGANVEQGQTVRFDISEPAMGTTP
ncbi:MAG: Ser-Thr-rich GPI-anchored membrane family protein [Ilumatobacteraceae bacterium]